MIRLFRKIRHKLLSEKSYSIYLLYATGEIALVMIGILLALQIDNWSDERKMKELEHELLTQFQTDLQTDIETIGQVNFWYQKTIYSCEVLIDHLKNRIPFHDSLKIHFDQWNEFQVFNYNTAAISNLNSRGVELISNVELRNQILKLYNQYLPSNLKSNNYFREDHVHITYKIHLERIEPLVWRESAMPNNYTALFDDQVFINHLQWIKNAAMFNTNENISLLGEIGSVIDLIEKVQSR